MRILDTDTISAVSWDPIPERVEREFYTSPRVHTTAINVAELLFGIRRCQSRRLMRDWETIVAPVLEVLPFTEQAAYEYVRLRLNLEAQGTPIGDMDLMVASVALAHDAILVTGNTRHFSRVPGLRLENWLE
jgi:tRNA(fMet)-specific endonuclease VapC